MQHIYIANTRHTSGNTSLAASLAQQCIGQGFNVHIHERQDENGYCDWWLERNYGLCVAHSAMLHEMSSVEMLGLEPFSLQSDGFILLPVCASPEDIRAAAHWLLALYRNNLLPPTAAVGVIGEGLCQQEALQYSFNQFVGLVGTGLNVQFFDWPSRRCQLPKASWQPLLEWLQLDFRHALSA